MEKKLVSIHGFQPSAALRVTGEDAFEFLQGQFTNDLHSPTGSATYGLWLNQKGKVLADSEVLRIGDREFMLASASSAASLIIQRLDQYIIADDVILEDQTATLSGLSVWGEGAALVLQDLIGGVPTTGRFLEKRGVIAFRRQEATAGFQFLGPREGMEGLRTTFLARGCAEATDSDAEFVRIAAGVPSIPRDIGPSDLPQEAGLEAAAISFNKGCYLGQEVMARLKSMGQVRRRLQRIRGHGAAPAHGTTLFQGAKKVGEIRSAVATPDGFVAFAMLTRMGLDENAGLAFDVTGKTESVVSIWTK